MEQPKFEEGQAVKVMYGKDESSGSFAGVILTSAGSGRPGVWWVEVVLETPYSQVRAPQMFHEDQIQTR